MAAHLNECISDEDVEAGVSKARLEGGGAVTGAENGIRRAVVVSIHMLAIHAAKEFPYCAVDA